ncbi:MAG: hypothetical protein Q4B86_00130 [Eubacteriales bacterium]|nr:hypothetical protein [Eubacteriales bacterium]
MDETFNSTSSFRLVVRDIRTMSGPCIAVMGIVEGSSISVNDYICRSTTDGKTVKMWVERIMSLTGLELCTAQPGKAVCMILHGRKAKQLQKGDILKPPTSGRRRHSTTIETITVILGILLIANLINIAVCLPMGWNDNISAIFRHSLILAAINIPMLLAVTGWDFLSKRRWKQKQRRDDLDMEFSVLKCSSSVYQFLILPVALTVLTGVILYQAAVDDPHELWDIWSNGGLKKYILMLALIDLLFICCFLHSSWRKVFYSRHLLRVVSFGLAHDIPWAQVRSLHLVQEQRRTRMILKTDENRPSL